MKPSQVEQIEQDLKRIVGEVESAAQSAGEEGSAAVRNLKQRLGVALDGARERLDDMQYGLRDAARTTDRYVHDSPWQAVGAAAVVGFLAGIVVAMGSRRR
jgi:ElaB/YqjD/DUF883 family membrane-anchored ribosome-binding protein